MVALLFPGQGTQFVGMGRELAAEFPAARAVFEEADEALGMSLSSLAWDGPESELTLTHNAQPAVLVHSIAAYRVASDQLGDVRCAAGHSLGEFSAYVAAGALNLADAVRTVRRRGELMLRSGEQTPGTMVAVLGLNAGEVERVCRDAATAGGTCVAANYNAPQNVVVSGDVPTVERAIELARAAGAKRAIPLKVSGAFHSPLMSVATPGFTAQLDTAALAAPRFPVISNVTAQPVTDPVSARRLLIEQLTMPVRWTACMDTMVQSGVREFVELGPGTVLCGLLKRIDGSATCRSLAEPAHIEAFRA